MGESRTELLQWLNDLLQLNYTKIEQCGTGAAYCQILDSIYGMHLRLYFPFPTLLFFPASEGNIQVLDVANNHRMTTNLQQQTTYQYTFFDLGALLTLFRQYPTYRRCTSNSRQVRGETRIRVSSQLQSVAERV
jgi:hypothetical protein